MSGRKPAAPDLQPKHFAFTPENLAKAEKVVAKYPKGKQQSAILSLFYLVQNQHDNWLPIAAIQYVADYLKMPYIRAFEVATFYTMFNLAPVGKHHIQICRTTPCWLRGSDEITHVCRNKLGIDMHEVTRDGKFSLVEVECLGACVNAPMVQINDDYYEDLDAAGMEKLIDDLASGKPVKKGSQKGRHASEPALSDA